MSRKKSQLATFRATINNIMRKIISFQFLFLVAIYTFYSNCCGSTLRHNFEQADFVFSATVHKIKDSIIEVNYDSLQDISIRIISISNIVNFKGDLKSNTIIYSIIPDNCENDFAIDSLEYLFFANGPIRNSFLPLTGFFDSKLLLDNLICGKAKYLLAMDTILINRLKQYKYPEFRKKDETWEENNINDIRQKDLLRIRKALDSSNHIN